jgi:hypothetical protein
MKTKHPALVRLGENLRNCPIIIVSLYLARVEPLKPKVLTASMTLPPTHLPSKDKLILTGLFLSKFDKAGLKALGFETFIEAFNVIGYALGSRPASIKNYRDEFDPLHSNPRKGWHKRPRREHCMSLKDAFDHLDLSSFASLIRNFTGVGDNVLVADESEKKSGSGTFAQRLMTGLAAEHYFQTTQPRIDQFSFSSCTLEDTTKLGCGYDFRLWPAESDQFFAIEVKGLKDRSGSLALTEREHDSAGELAQRYFLFVVKNFSELPYHEIHQNPLTGPLAFSRKERVVVQVSWVASA